LKNNRGAFIALEGIDGTGKTTQATQLARRIEGVGLPVVRVHEPGSTKAGDAIRELLLRGTSVRLSSEAELFLYMASRAQLVEEVIKPALASGKTVVSDRFLASSIAYQGAGNGLGCDRIREIGLVATGGLLPDLTLVLDMPVAAAFARLGDGRDRIEARPVEYHERVRAGFLAEADRDPGHVRVVDGRATVEAVGLAVWEIVQDVLELHNRS